MLRAQRDMSTSALPRISKDMQQEVRHFGSQESADYDGTIYILKASLLQKSIIDEEDEAV